MRKYKAFLIGNGTMGKRHKAYFEKSQVEFLKVIDKEEFHPSEIKKMIFEERKKPDFVVIASPATSHYFYASFFLKRRIPVFVEKPLASDFEEAQDLYQLTKANQTLLFIAQSECYNPRFLKFRKIFTKVSHKYLWCDLKLVFNREHGKSCRGLDVDVALDLMVHDLSLFLTIVNSKDIFILNYSRKENDAHLVLKVHSGDFSGLSVEFFANRESVKDTRDVTLWDGQGKSVLHLSLADYQNNGDIVHSPTSLENEHKVFFKLLKGDLFQLKFSIVENAFDAIRILTSRKITP